MSKLMNKKPRVLTSWEIWNNRLAEFEPETKWKEIEYNPKGDMSKDGVRK